MYNGIINVYKEKGYTSHDVVAKLRGILRQKKIGHTGTLDPDAQGVLPVCLGSGTKLSEMLTDKDKTYSATLLLGITTDTQDTSGTIQAKAEVNVNEAEVKDAILSFVGEYNQIPPMYSAIKVNGKKLYELAREGKEINRASRLVKINEIIIEELKLPRIKITVSCSKGTYIRTLCHDIGNVLGCGGCMEELLRIKSGRFHLKDSYKLDEIIDLRDKGLLEDIIISVENIFLDYEKCVVKEEYSKLIYNGNPFGKKHLIEHEISDINLPVRVYDHKDTFIGIYQYKLEIQLFKAIKMFLN
ncbi:MAG: tRNA pseudouridine(55) synthase TruB [Clostridiales bacterium]|nr:tRNA pseudouridine(55) synthase TruB [Clostridiales bacterium]